MSCDWSDGFLFIGNKLSLDFLNTRPLMAGAPLELLPDCASLARWLKAAGLLSKREGKRLERKWSARPAFAGMVRELREFREELRQTVLEMEAGAPPPAAFIAKANELLSAHPYIDELVQTNSRLDREKRFEPRRPLDVFAPVMDSVATLLTMDEKSRLRKCESCVLHFHDTSKKGTRRW